jgi:hypothetical protein
MSTKISFFCLPFCFLPPPTPVRSVGTGLWDAEAGTVLAPDAPDRLLLALPASTTT